jgi:hypothetical protein
MFSCYCKIWKYSLIRLIATDQCSEKELLSNGFAIIPTQISRICGQKANTIAITLY